MKREWIQAIEGYSKPALLAAVLILVLTVSAGYTADAAAARLGAGVPQQQVLEEISGEQSPDLERTAAAPAPLVGCYSDEALVMSYLSVPAVPETHSLLEELEKTQQRSVYSYSAVSMATSGRENLAYWQSINSDVVGWLKVSGTNINYPVVQGPYTDYYTKLGYYKETSHNGVIWASSSSSIGSRGNLSPNTVIYGHNWTNCSAYPKVGSGSDVMFAQLTAFHHLWFAQENQYIYFSTGSDEMVWQIFAAFYADTGFAYNTANPSSLQSIIDGARARSEHNYSVSVSSSDKILTLSTCTRRFNPYDNRQRFVVMAKLVDSMGSGSTVTSNPYPQRPNLS